MKNKKHRCRILSILTPLLFVCDGFAGELWYAGIDLDVYDIQINNESYFPRQLKVNLGHWIRRGIGAEIHLGSDIRSDAENGFEIQARRYEGIYLRWQSLQPGLKAFFLTGYGQLTLDGDVNNSRFPGNERFSGPVVSLGLSAPFRMDSQWRAGLSYNHYFFEDDLTIESVNAGVRYAF